MPEETDKYIRIPVAECDITATIDISKEEGIKALYCGKDKKIATYLFLKEKGWTMAKAKKWVKEHKEDKDMKNKETFWCECLDCGHKFESEEHCNEVKCPECGGKCRRVERPGPGQKSAHDAEPRGAIGPHKTATSDKAWDGPKNEKNLKADGDAAYYRKAFGWVDPDKDAETKAAYRFIHHEVSGDGNIGAANIKGCQTGIGVLNGARGGTTIPSEDRKGVWNHLAGHIKDADLEPAPLRSFIQGKEERSYQVEMRIDDGDKPKIKGHAAVFDKLSVSIMGFREKVSPGAFAKSIQKSDIRALWNHNPDYVLGRKKSGTLSLEEDKKGLAIEISPPDTQWARDLMETIKRGDVDQMSFAFQVVRDSWDESGKENVRTLEEVELFDVSPVTYPAYPQTDVKVRSAFEKAGRGAERAEGGD